MCIRDSVKESTELLTKSGLNFIGNVEGNDLISGTADVVVCDGFVGNVVLKLIEGLGKGLSNQLHSALSGKIPGELLDGLMQELYKNNNVVDARGGGPIFGVNGVSIIGHGSATAGTVQRAVGTARMCIETKLIVEMLAQVKRVRAKTT